jgi:hypothetical protein
MLIFVNIKQSYKPGSDPKQFAVGNWVSKRVFIDSEFRNRFRFLVAYANKRILGVYKIIGIKPVIGLINRQRVYFEVDSLNPAFEIDLINRLQGFVDQNDRRIIFNSHIRFLDDLDISVIQEEYPEEFSSLTFPIEEIYDPIFDVDGEYFEEQIADVEGGNRQLMEQPIEPMWYEITVNYHSFDSFRTPVAIHTKTTVTLSSQGIIKMVKEVNSIRVSTRLNQNFKNKVKQLIYLFNTDPVGLTDQLNASDKLIHVAHVNPFSLEIKAFSDAANQHLLRQFLWEDNVAFPRFGLLSSIFQLFIN